MTVLKRAILVTLLGVFVASCGPTYKSGIMDPCRKEGNTEDKCQAAYAWSFKIFFTKEDPDNKGYTVITSLLTWADLEKQIKTLRDNLDAILDPKNLEEAQFLQTFNLKKPMEHEEQVVKLLGARVHTAKLDLSFRKMMGQVSYMDMPDHEDGFNAKKIFTMDDPTKVFPFTSAQIEEAKAAGVLKPIEHLPLQLDQQLAKKVFPDPDDTNDFTWKPISWSLDLTNYKILNVDKPEDSLGNYIEGYRVVNGKKESKPALKIFFISGGTAVVVVDSDKEGSNTGWGLPDYVEEVAGLVSVTQVASGILSGDSLLRRVFEEKPEDQRIAPPVKKIYVEIAKVGEPLDVWEKAPTGDGWLVPFPYANNKKDNYNVKIKFKSGHGHSTNPDEMTPDFMEIEYIAKEWTGRDRYTPSTGAVVEYYRPKNDFAGKVQALVPYQDDMKKVRFTFDDGHEEVGIITPGLNRFIEEKPYAIDYNEGQRRLHIEKSGNGVFDKRKEIAKPKENKTGQYNTADEDSSTSSQMKAANKKDK